MINVAGTQFPAPGGMNHDVSNLKERHGLSMQCASQGNSTNVTDYLSVLRLGNFCKNSSLCRLALIFPAPLRQCQRFSKNILKQPRNSDFVPCSIISDNKVWEEIVDVGLSDNARICIQSEIFMSLLEVC